MLNRKDYKNFKTAGVTIEVSLAMALGIVILFLAIGIFSENLKTMALSSGMQNLFNKDKTAAKTEGWGTGKSITLANDPTASQENVQVVASQGLTLNQYVANAQATINQYTTTPPTTEAQMEDLAKALTIYAVSIGTTNNINNFVATKNGIRINFNSTDADMNPIGKTTVNGKTISYDTPTTDLSSQDLKLSIVKNVSNLNFQ